MHSEALLSSAVGLLKNAALVVALKEGYLLRPRAQSTIQPSLRSSHSMTGSVLGGKVWHGRKPIWCLFPPTHTHTVPAFQWGKRTPSQRWYTPVFTAEAQREKKRKAVVTRDRIERVAKEGHPRWVFCAGLSPT